MQAKIETRVVLDIDELVLHGLPGRQRQVVAAAVEAELQRLLEQDGLPPELACGGFLPQVQVDGLRLAAGAEPETVGARIAGSIYRSLAGLPESCSHFRAT